MKYTYSQVPGYNLQNENNYKENILYIIRWQKMET